MRLRKKNFGTGTVIQYEIHDNSGVWSTFNQNKLKLTVNETLNKVMFTEDTGEEDEVFQRDIDISSVVNADNGDVAFTIDSIQEYFLNENYFQSSTKGIFGVSSSIFLPKDSSVQVNDLTPVLSFRIKSGFSGIFLNVKDISFSCTSNGDLQFHFIKNAVLTTPTWEDVQNENGNIERDYLASNLTGGFFLKSGTLSNNNDNAFMQLKYGEIIVNDGDIITIAAETFGGNEDVFSVVNVEEFKL
jgi:hypothetical protein